MPRSVVSRRARWLAAQGPRRVAGLLLATCLAGAASCVDSLSPGRLSDARPWLRSLSFDDISTHLTDGGTVVLLAVPTDSTFSLELDQRVPVDVVASSGDHEEVGLYNVLCPTRQRLPGHFQCFLLDVSMEAGHDATEIASELQAAGGRFLFISATGWFAQLVFFSPVDPVGRALRARSWPGVATVELPPLGCVFGPACPSLTAPLAVAGGAASQGDGVLQIRPGDTVVVSYRQPDGSALRTQLVAP